MMYKETTQIQIHGCTRTAAEVADIHTTKKVFANFTRTAWMLAVAELMTIYVQPAVKIMFWRHYYAHKIIKIERSSRLNDKVTYMTVCVMVAFYMHTREIQDIAAYFPCIQTCPFPHLPQTIQQESSCAAKEDNKK